MVDRSFSECFMKAKYDEDIKKELDKKETRIDQMQKDITDYLVKITSKELNESQSELIPVLMHCTNDAERIADHTSNLMSLTKRLKSGKVKFSDSAQKDISIIWETLENQAKNVIKGLNKTSLKNVNIALDDEKLINEYTKKFEKEHIKRLRKEQCDVTAGIIFIEMLAELERIGDRLANIAERTPVLQKHFVKLDKSE